MAAILTIKESKSEEKATHALSALPGNVARPIVMRIIGNDGVSSMHLKILKSLKQWPGLGWLGWTPSLKRSTMRTQSKIFLWHKKGGIDLPMGKGYVRVCICIRLICTSDNDRSLPTFCRNNHLLQLPAHDIVGIPLSTRLLYIPVNRCESFSSPLQLSSIFLFRIGCLAFITNYTAKHNQRQMGIYLSLYRWPVWDLPNGMTKFLPNPQ